MYNNLRLFIFLVSSLKSFDLLGWSFGIFIDELSVVSFIEIKTCRRSSFHAHCFLSFFSIIISFYFFFFFHFIWLAGFRVMSTCLNTFLVIFDPLKSRVFSDLTLSKRFSLWMQFNPNLASIAEGSNGHNEGSNIVPKMKVGILQIYNRACLV